MYKYTHFGTGQYKNCSWSIVNIAQTQTANVNMQATARPTKLPGVSHDFLFHKTSVGTTHIL
jgi:hypothetical protein